MEYALNRDRPAVADQLTKGAAMQAQATSMSNEARDRPSRQIDDILEHNAAQIGAMMSLMRRVEDLADRISGAEPSKPEAGTAAPALAGWVGALSSMGRERDAILSRAYDALDRIERVL